jgi:hypothetical protein
MIRNRHRFCASSGSLRLTQAHPSPKDCRAGAKVREIGSGLTEDEAMEKAEVDEAASSRGRAAELSSQTEPEDPSRTALRRCRTPLKRSKNARKRPFWTSSKMGCLGPAIDIAEHLFLDVIRSAALSLTVRYGAGEPASDAAQPNTCARCFCNTQVLYLSL